MGKNRDKNQYLNDYPKTSKWINECIICRAKGYDPRIEIKNEKIMVENIKSFFPPLELNDEGMCPVCEKIFHKKQ